MSETTPIFRMVKFGSLEQRATIKLRDDLLRKPLNLQFSAEELAAEESMFHLAGYLGEDLACCMVLIDKGNGLIKMRQVAVANEHQRKGLGAKMSLWMESWCKENGYSKVYCHARSVVAPFYTSLGYRIVGDEFIEVGIPHFEMEKELKIE